MTKILLKIMYSDVIATIEDGVNEKVTLKDDNNVASQVKGYLEENFLKKSDVELEEISILLLSYTNPPQIPSELPCSNWTIKCESHTPYVLDLLKSIPSNCEKLHIEVDNSGFGDIANTEQVITAKNLSLKTSDVHMELGVSKEQIEKFQAMNLCLNGEKR